jgi:hypothetical protein
MKPQEFCLLTIRVILVSTQEVPARKARDQGDNAMRARWQGSCLWVAAWLMMSGGCYAQSTGATPDQEYQKLIQVDQNVDPVGEHPFGEIINVRWIISFSVTDVSLRGNGPTITVGRTLQSFEWPTNTSTPLVPTFPFGDWDLDIPRIETLVGSSANASSAIWQTILGGTGDTGTTQRCTNFYEPPGIAAFPLANGGWVASEWWYGYNLFVPGEGKQLLMPRYSANTLSPTISGMSFNIVTKNNWMLGCGVTASDGGEGFLAIAPDGTRYTFAHLVYRPWYEITVRVLHFLLTAQTLRYKLRPRRRAQSRQIAPSQHTALRPWWLVQAALVFCIAKRRLCMSHRSKTASAIR